MFVQRSLAVVIGLLIGLGVLEVGIRALSLAPQLAPIVIDQPYGQFESSANPLLPYVPRPGSPDVNAWGIRDRDYAFEKPEGTHRIVVLGDSIGFGLCTERESLAPADTFAKVLEARLQADPLPGFTRSEVINLSVSGYDTRQEVAFFVEKGLAFDPDMVVVGYCLNDDEDSSLELETIRGQSGFAASRVFGREAMDSIFATSHTARLLWYRLALLRGGAEEPGPDAPSRRAEGFQRLGGLATQHGFETLVVVFPFLDGAPRYRYAKRHTDTHADARAQGFAVLDLLETFQQASGGRLPVIRGRCRGMHPDERGHRIAAERMEREIRALYTRG